MKSNRQSESIHVVCQATIHLDTTPASAKQPPLLLIPTSYPHTSSTQPLLIYPSTLLNNPLPLPKLPNPPPLLLPQPLTQHPSPSVRLGQLNHLSQRMTQIAQHVGRVRA